MTGLTARGRTSYGHGPTGYSLAVESHPKREREQKNDQRILNEFLPASGPHQMLQYLHCHASESHVIIALGRAAGGLEEPTAALEAR
jgi:hypothetical protein